MKKTYIEPNIEVLVLKMQNVIATSLFDNMGPETTADETIEGD